MHYNYLIIGGGIAGVTAAETIRTHNLDASIGIVSLEPHVIYSRVLLPHFLKRRIPRANLFLRTSEDFTSKKIDLHQEETVVSIDPKHKDVTLENGKIFGYDKLLLATGGTVKEWGRPEDTDMVYRLQTLDDADRMSGALALIKRPLVVGSSFISLEFLEIFLANMIVPTLLVRDSHFFGHLIDAQGGELMHENFLRLGIAVDYGDTIAHIERKADMEAEVTTKNSKKISADAIAVGVGIDRNMAYARESGFEVGEHGIRVNEYLETNHADVFAAGDIAEFYDVIARKHWIVGNWTSAVLQGKRAGLNMMGMREPFVSVPSYSITNLGFQITALGDTTHHEGAVVRTDKARKQYERFFFENDILIGAVLINRFADKTHLAKLIEQRTDMRQLRGELINNSFDIHSISVVG